MDYTQNVILLSRNQRNKLLSDSDKYVLPDYPISSNNLILIKEYRQNLRNFMDSDAVLNYNYTSNIFPNFPPFPF